MINLKKEGEMKPYHSTPYAPEFDIIGVERIGWLEKNVIKLS